MEAFAYTRCAPPVTTGDCFNLLAWEEIYLTESYHN